MKRFFTLTALLISIVSFAAPLPRAGRIIVSNQDNSLIHVRINGRSYNVDGQPLIISNLAGGRHQVQIFKSERKPFGYTRSRPVMIYNAAVYVDPSYIVDLNVVRNDRRYNDNRFDNNRRDDTRYQDNRYDDKRYNNNDYDNNRYNNNDYDNNRYNDDPNERNRFESPKPGTGDERNTPGIPGRSTRPARQ
jgi:hypothetical protein